MDILLALNLTCTECSLQGHLAVDLMEDQYEGEPGEQCKGRASVWTCEDADGCGEPGFWHWVKVDS